MRTIRFILRKEFLQIFRNKAMLPIIFVVPIIQLLVLPLAATYEVKNSKLLVIDQDMSPDSQKLRQAFEASRYFSLHEGIFTVAESDKLLDKRAVDMVLVIPRGFVKNWAKGQMPRLALRVNAMDGSKAGIIAGYAQEIIGRFNGELAADFSGNAFSRRPTIQTEFSYWFNTELNYKPYMVSAILAVLVTMVCLFLSAMNIVKEKELGTIEQINVTPIRKHEFLIGKLLPFWCIGMFELIFGLGLTRLVYGIELAGSVWVVLSFSGLYMVCVLGIGLLVSIYNHTQQQAIFVAWFFMMLFILISGIFTSLESMPRWAQYVAHAVR
ncbi:MAG: ABC transporter permease [Cytophagales bacterium]|nr:ABC transporter permease [Cytophagales bacterium]